MLFDKIKKHLPTPTKEGSYTFTGSKRRSMEERLTLPDAIEEDEDIGADEDVPEELYLRSEQYDNIFYHMDNDMVLERLRSETFEDPELVNIHTQARDFTIFPGFDRLLSLQMAKGLISYE